jgi:hypothetical protein
MTRSCLLILAAAVALSSCRRGAQEEAAVQTKGNQEEPHTEAVTRWTAKTELFLEYPTLVAGTTSRFAVHFTNLATFKAQKSGKVDVILKAGDAAQVFNVAAPSRALASLASTFNPAVRALRDEHRAFRALSPTGTIWRGDGLPGCESCRASRRGSPARRPAILKSSNGPSTLPRGGGERPARDVMRVPGEARRAAGGEAVRS